MTIANLESVLSIEFHKLSPEDVSELLLSYAKGRLSQDDCKALDAAIANSPEYLEELEVYKGLARAAALRPEDAVTPGALGWARLSRAMDEIDADRQTPEAANDNVRSWRYAALALGAVVLGQLAFTVSKSASDTDSRYVPVSASQAGSIAQITFSPDATEGDIRALLLASEASLVSGPSALGVYQIAFRDDASRMLGLSLLAEATGIVESAAAQE